MYTFKTLEFYVKLIVKHFMQYREFYIKHCGYKISLSIYAEFLFRQNKRNAKLMRLEVVNFEVNLRVLFMTNMAVDCVSKIDLTEETGSEN